MNRTNMTNDNSENEKSLKKKHLGNVNPEKGALKMTSVKGTSGK